MVPKIIHTAAPVEKGRQRVKRGQRTLPSRTPSGPLVPLPTSSLATADPGIGGWAPQHPGVARVMGEGDLTGYPWHAVLLQTAAPGRQS